MSWCNIMTHWVATKVLECDSKTARVKMVKKLIRLAQCCYEYHNFFALHEILLGLISAPIKRLRLTWHKLETSETKTFRDWQNLTRIMSPQSSYSTYRTQLANISPPRLPYLGMISLFSFFQKIPLFGSQFQ